MAKATALVAVLLPILLLTSSFTGFAQQDHLDTTTTTLPPHNHSPAPTPAYPPQPNHHHHPHHHHSPAPAPAPLHHHHSPAPAPAPLHHHHHHSPAPAPAPLHHHHHHSAPTPAPPHGNGKRVYPPRPPVLPPAHPSAHPPAHAPAHTPAHAPAHPPAHVPVYRVPRSFVAVQGVVYVKSCKNAGLDTLLGAVPVLGAVVKLQCNNTRYKLVQTAQTDVHGYFFLEAPKTITTYGAHKCNVVLASEPAGGLKPSNFHGGLTGASLRPEKPYKSNNLPYFLYTIGPLAFEPKCPH